MELSRYRHFAANHHNVASVTPFAAGPELPLPLALSQVEAGFPSPAEDYVDKALDLNELCVRNPSATFFVRVRGESMRDAGITSGDILVVDRSLEAAQGNIVVAEVEGEMTVKRYVRRGGEVLLCAENPEYPPLRLNGEMEALLWGVVTHIIKRTR